jgi:hypothetical protein
MGGIGSGSPYGSRFRSIESSYGLDLARVQRAGYLVPGRKTAGAWKWWTGDDPEPTCVVGLEFDLRDADAPTYRIQYTSTVRATGETEEVDILNDLLCSEPLYGGTRYWFRCPQCWWHRRVLYAPQGAVRFACRRCHRLRYASQREREPDRLLRRARKRWRRAGSTDDHEPWKKPKWMRWNTFSRLVLEGREAQEQGDWLFLKGFSAGLARIIDKRRRG